MVKEFLNSEKFIRASRWLIILTFISSLVYLFLRYYLKDDFFSFVGIFLPLGFAIRANRVFLILMLVMFVLCIPAFYFSKIKSYLAVIVSLLIFPFFCLFSFLALDSHSITDQIRFKNHKYFYVNYPMIGDFPGIESLYRCDSFGRNCQTLYDSVSNQLIPLEFQINEERDQLYIFHNYSLSWIDRGDLVPFHGISFGYFAYNDYHAIYDYYFVFDAEENNFFLSICNKKNYDQNCELWLMELSNLEIDFEEGYFEHGGAPPLSGDDPWNENYFYVGDELIFYVTDEPVCVVEGCVFVEE